VLVHLPLGYTSGHTRDGLINAIQTFPPQLRRSLAWDQGAETAMHKAITTATGVPVYFCNPGSPWQRGSNENTNGLLRQYFPKGPDLSRHGHKELDAVATALNSRPRKTLGWETPTERLSQLLATARQQSRVATITGIRHMPGPSGHPLLSRPPIKVSDLELQLAAEVVPRNAVPLGLFDTSTARSCRDRLPLRRLLRTGAPTQHLQASLAGGIHDPSGRTQRGIAQPPCLPCAPVFGYITGQTIGP